MMSTFSLFSSRTMFFTARSAHADAGADRIDFLVRAGDGDLGPIAGLARDAANLHRAVVDLADFEFEESPDEIRMAARNDDLRAANPVFDRHDISAQPVADIVVFDHDAFALRHDRFEFSEIENHIRAIETPDRSADDLARAILELLINHFFLDLADALHHRLLRGLGGDASKILRRHFHFHFVADRRVRIDLARLGNGNLVRRIGDVIDHEQFGQGADLAGLRIDIDAKIARGARHSFSKRKEGRWRPPRAGSRV